MGFAPSLLMELEPHEKTDKTVFVIQKDKLSIDHEDDRQLSCWKNLMSDEVIDIVINDTQGLWQVNEVSLSHYMNKISLTF